MCSRVRDIFNKKKKSVLETHTYVLLNNMQKFLFQAWALRLLLFQVNSDKNIYRIVARFPNIFSRIHLTLERAYKFKHEQHFLFAI